MDSKRLDLNLLVTLEALLIEQNVTRAAARLHLSQPAVSAQLNRLRKVFDDPLLIPAQRGMTPTVKALELLEPVRQALDQVRSTVSRHRNFDPARAEMTITVTCTDYLQYALVEPLVLELRKTAPRVRIAIRNLDLPQLEAQMARGDVDLALMTPTDAPANLRTRHLFHDRYVLIGRKDHPRLSNRLSIKQFTELEHVIVSLRGRDFVTPVDISLAALGLRRNVVLSAASFLFVPDIVARSDFVALVPERLVCERTETLRLIESPFPVEGFSVGMIWHERTHGHSGHRWIREAIVSLANARLAEHATASNLTRRHDRRTKPSK
ncbi:LysR family transcriptional regulator [Bradyrhizobium sp. Leo170]|uniref:LysR family transcriptional regulator n=1 Tax=Bradyrhizobium sp. Leo170 TaxID=1571199 RepID=UPI00102ECB53|nr:LysR family transcriptional regulator [Bradyrhizobium sp. Leo170]TAI67361.1 LysR family transcriptional regulator [Bradyrhizobium sp. Leo170]